MQPSGPSERANALERPALMTRPYVLTIMQSNILLELSILIKLCIRMVSLFRIWNVALTAVMHSAATKDPVAGNDEPAVATSATANATMGRLPKLSAAYTKCLETILQAFRCAHATLLWIAVY